MSASWNWTWFACLVVAPVAAETVVPRAEGAETRRLEIIAQRSFVDDPLISIVNPADEPADLLVIRNSERAHPLVIRSRQELAAASLKARNASEAAAVKDDASLQMEVEQRLLTSLELAEIDWEKHMVVAVLATGSYRRPPRWEFVSCTTTDDTLIVQVSGTDGEFGCGFPWALAVVERFDEQVEFTGKSTRSR